jgi:hypothetical protein
MGNEIETKRIRVNDRTQRGYDISNKPWEKGLPRDLPELTPKQMLRLGIFGGKYMTDCASAR